MPEINERIDLLQARLENLVKSQEWFLREIAQIRYEINVLRAVQQKTAAPPQNQPRAGTQPPPQPRPPIRENIPPPPPTAPRTEPQQTFETDRQQTNYSTRQSSSEQNYSRTASPTSQPSQQSKNNLEKFVGENLISKIGIVILVLGVAIGAKYAIDRNLISPLTRIIFGYIFGFGLLGFAFKLKPKYHSFSAVLLSGAMAIMYFITYFAYSLYEIFPATTAFILMLVFTAFTVAAAINYNRVVIAQIGLVGAYAIPFLLSDNSGKFAFLFTYIAIINAGILAISIKKYWRSLLFTSFIFTWASYAGWYLFEYRTAEHFNLALVFLTIFFLTFYITFIIYKLLAHENVAIENIILILANSLIFYGLGYSILDGREGFENYTGTFTVVNAGIHFVFAFTVSRMKLVPNDLIYLLVGTRSDLCDHCRSGAVGRKFRNSRLDGGSRDPVLDRARQSDSAL